MSSKNKDVVIGILLTVVFVMAIGYAAFSQDLEINGSTSVGSSWDIHILSIVPTNTVGSASNHTMSTEGWPMVTSISDDRYSATFATALQSPSDSLTYTVTVENSGTINAKVAESGITFSDAQANLNNLDRTDAIIFTYDGIKPGDKIAANGGIDTFTVTAQYNPSVSSQPSAEQLKKAVTMTLNYVQDKDA